VKIIYEKKKMKLFDISKLFSKNIKWGLSRKCISILKTVGDWEVTPNLALLSKIILFFILTKFRIYLYEFLLKFNTTKFYNKTTKY